MKNKEVDPVGAKLKELRLAKGWKQGKLAKKAGVSQSTISQYENGGRSRNEQKFLNILTALGTNRAEFFSDIEANNENENDLKKRVKILEEIILKK